MTAGTAEVTRHSFTHRSIHTEHPVDAPAEVVWATLIDAENMPAWSSTFQGIEGDLRQGGAIVLLAKAMGWVIRVSHSLAFYNEGTELGWSESGGPGVTDRHIFRVEPVSETTSMFIQTDQMKGPGVPFMAWMMMRIQKNMYTTFNAELADEAERRHRSGAS